MARVEEARRHFVNWAEWKKSGGPSAACLAIEQIDALISRWPDDLRSTVVEVYLKDGDMRVHASRLGCPEATISRRLGRAERLLLDQLCMAEQHDRNAAALNGMR